MLNLFISFFIVLNSQYLSATNHATKVAPCKYWFYLCKKGNKIYSTGVVTSLWTPSLEELYSPAAGCSFTGPFTSFDDANKTLERNLRGANYELVNASYNSNCE
jgi:hypothetical protein